MARGKMPSERRIPGWSDATTAAARQQEEVQRWDYFIHKQLLPHIAGALRVAAPSVRSVPPLKVSRDQWGVTVLSMPGVVDTTWAERLVMKLRGRAEYREYTVEFQVRGAAHWGARNGLPDPSMGKMTRIDATSPETMRAGAVAAQKRMGASTFHFEVRLRRS